MIRYELELRDDSVIKEFVISDQQILGVGAPPHRIIRAVDYGGRPAGFYSARNYHRRDYSHNDAQAICDWLNRRNA